MIRAALVAWEKAESAGPAKLTPAGYLAARQHVVDALAMPQPPLSQEERKVVAKCTQLATGHAQRAEDEREALAAQLKPLRAARARRYASREYAAPLHVSRLR